MTPLLQHVLWAIAIGSGVYVGMGGLVHYAYFVRRRDDEARWRIQPGRPIPTWGDVRARMPLVAGNLVLFNGILGATAHAALTGRTRLVSDATPLAFALAPLPFLLFHVVAYGVHRVYHAPRLFPLIHAVHHRSRTPFFVDGLVMHPIEAITSALVVVLPAFVVPTHIGAFALYVSLVGMHEFLDHTGIHLRFPGMSPSSHHDEHHRSVRRCYAQTFTFLDTLLDTGPNTREPPA